MSEDVENKSGDSLRQAKSAYFVYSILIDSMSREIRAIEQRRFTTRRLALSVHQKMTGHRTSNYSPDNGSTCISCGWNSDDVEAENEIENA